MKRIVVTLVASSFAMAAASNGASQGLGGALKGLGKKATDNIESKVPDDPGKPAAAIRAARSLASSVVPDNLVKEPSRVDATANGERSTVNFRTAEYPANGSFDRPTPHAALTACRSGRD